MNRELIYTPEFLRDSRRWAKSHPQDRVAINSTVQQLTRDAFDPKLRTHKLKGRLGDCWACRVRYDLRILFEFSSNADGETISLLALGTHDELY